MVLMQKKSLKRIGKKLALVGLGLLLAGGAVLLVIHKKSELAEKSPPSVRPIPVHTAKAIQGRLPVFEHYIGTIEPLIYADLSPRVTGHLATVAGDVGDTLQKGEAAALLDPRLPAREKEAVAAELRGAKETLSLSEKRYKRRRKIVDNGAVSKEALDEARRQYELDKARVERLEKELAAKGLLHAYARLTAPFDGIISRRMKDPGDLISPGVPVLRIEKPDAGYKVLARVSQAAAGRISAGDTARLSFEKKRQEAVIDRIQPAMEPAGLAVMEIRVKEKPFHLPSGATIGVDVCLKRPEGIVIPLNCLLEQEEKNYVFIIDQARMTASAVPVQLLGKSGDKAVVKGNIPEGARLVSGRESMLIRLGNKSPVQPVARREDA